MHNMKTKLSLVILLSCLVNSFLKANTPTLTDSIQVFIKKYQYEKAIVVIDRLLSKEKKSAELFYLKGTALRGLFNYNGAVDCYLQALTIDSINNSFLIELANTYKLIPDYENALKCFIKAIRIDPENTMLQVERANCLYLMEMFPIALINYQGLYQRDTANYYVIKKLALCYSRLNQPDSAIAYYYKAKALNPLDPINILSLSNLLIGQKCYEEGINLTNNYITKDSSNRKVNAMNAFLYLLNKEYVKSICKFNQCINSGDSSKFSYKNLGIAYFKLESFDTAKIFLEKGILTIP